MATKKPKAKKSPKTWEQLRKQGDKAWYAAYRRSHHWRRLRKQVLAARNYRCEKCGRLDPYNDTRRGYRLALHHLTYDRIGKEYLTDLQVLCETCHTQAHKSGFAIGEIVTRVKRLLG